MDHMIWLINKDQFLGNLFKWKVPKKVNNPFKVNQGHESNDMANAWSFICIYIAAIIYWSVRDLIKIAFLLILHLVIYLYLLNLEYWLMELSKLHVPRLLIVTLMTSTKLMIIQINDQALERCTERCMTLIHFECL